MQNPKAIKRRRKRKSQETEMACHDDDVQNPSSSYSFSFILLIVVTLSFLSSSIFSIAKLSSSSLTIMLDVSSSEISSGVVESVIDSV